MIQLSTSDAVAMCDPNDIYLFRWRSHCSSLRYYVRDMEIRKNCDDRNWGCMYLKAVNNLVYCFEFVVGNSGTSPGLICLKKTTILNLNWFLHSDKVNIKKILSLMDDENLY